MNKNKIINDPIYGLIRIPYGILLDIIDDSRFQRLRRIHQMGLSHLVYPGAVHTRFHHAIGAMHITWVALNTLRNKGVRISEDETIACLIAILLHDIGHGPYSHALEGSFLPVSHEFLSLMIMEEFNRDMNGELDLALEIFTDAYSRPFLHQLISSQLDMDRIDYLNRDSFYTGVIEGKIGYDRIITMLNVLEDELVVEEKAIFSVEKYLSSRSFMYRQVYLHKASLASELMLATFLRKLKRDYRQDARLSESLDYFLSRDFDQQEIPSHKDEILGHYLRMDDMDIMHCLKLYAQGSDDQILRLLASGLVNRRLFSVRFSPNGFSEEEERRVIESTMSALSCAEEEARMLVQVGVERKKGYLPQSNEIRVLAKSGAVINYSDWNTGSVTADLDLHYIVAPKEALRSIS